MKYKDIRVGMKVKYIGWDPEVEAIVRTIRTQSDIGIEFLAGSTHPPGHSLDGCITSGRGWWVFPSNLEKIATDWDD